MSLRRLRGPAVAAGLCLLPVLARPLAAQLTLETETARLPRRGVLEMGGNFEYQFSAAGREAALPFAFLYGLSDRLEFAVEPVPYTAIRQRGVRHATGPGDIEATLTYLLARESRHRPALAIAGEVKLPTARDSLIGTGRTDVAGYFIASRQFGVIDLHANVGYTIVGRIPNVPLNNIANFAVAAQLQVVPGTELYAEVLATTSSLRGGTAEGSTTPEAGGGELVGSVGVARDVAPLMQLSFGVSYDNTGAILLRPGFSIHLH